MACEAEKTAFEATLQRIQASLKDELSNVAKETESKTKDLSDKFKDNNDLAQGVGAAAGTIVGGALGGPGGAVAGAVVGKAIGALFVIEIREDTVKFSLDLPEITTKDEEWSLDLPEVTTKDTDIIFNIPTMVMKTVEGPPIPETVVEMVTECVDLGWPLGKACADVPHNTIRWKKTYLDMPTWEDRQQRIVVGLPTIEMKTQKMIVGVPQVAMKTEDVSFNVPVVSIKFAQDAGKQLADEAKTVAADAAILIAQKQAAFKDRMRQELVEPAHKMFGCHRSTLLQKRDEVAKFFNSQLDTITNSIITMTSNQVPETDPALVAVKARAGEMMKKRDEQLKQFDAAIEKLDKAAQEAINRFVS